MELAWSDPRSAKFITGVGLITSRGPFGDNIMSAEWTHHISYNPAMIAVCIGKEEKASAANIDASKEFTIHVAAADQNSLANIAGNNTGKEVDKIAVLKDLGYTFQEAKKIKTLVLNNTSFTAECKLLQKIDLGGSHEIFVGEVVEAYELNKIEPLVYHNRKFYKIGEQFHKPDQPTLDKIAALIKKYTKTAPKS